jgi:hypothetical protein
MAMNSLLQHVLGTVGWGFPTGGQPWDRFEPLFGPTQELDRTPCRPPHSPLLRSRSCPTLSGDGCPPSDPTDDTATVPRPETRLLKRFGLDAGQRTKQLDAVRPPGRRVGRVADEAWDRLDPGRAADRRTAVVSGARADRPGTDLEPLPIRGRLIGVRNRWMVTEQAVGVLVSCCTSGAGGTWPTAQAGMPPLKS